MDLPEIIRLSDVTEGPGIQPTLLSRVDGECLLYPRLIHWFAGEPESLKSWLALLATLQVTQRGGSVLYVDFEDVPESIKERMVNLGATEEELSRVFYVHPEDATTPEILELYLATIRECDISLVVLDGVTEGMTAEGLGITDNSEVAKWLARLARPLAWAGPAVVVIDHVTKNAETRGRYPIGAQHKLAGIWVAYAVDKLHDLSPALDEPVTGVARISVSKDRPGKIRKVCPDQRSLGQLHITAYPDGSLFARIVPAPERQVDTRPVDTMASVSAWLQDHGERKSVRAIREGTKARAQSVQSALTALEAEGYVEQTVGQRGAKLYTLLLPFTGQDPPAPPTDPFDLEPD